MALHLRVRCVALSVLCLSAIACDEKPAPSTTAAASAAPSATPVAPVPSVPPVAAPEPAASAAPSAAPGGEAAPSKDAMVMVKDPEKEKTKTVKAIVGGTVTLYLPDFPGTVWSYDGGDKTLGKPKEEIVPGFLGPTTPAHQFTWKTSGPLFKAGQTHHASFVNKKAGKPNGTFALTIVMM